MLLAEISQDDVMGDENLHLGGRRASRLGP
jgi:hypothetical protein